MITFVVYLVTSGLLGLHQTSTAQVTCASGEFACSDGLLCISEEFQCDTFADCHDNSDESGCVCDLNHEFQCEGGGCVNQTWVCDGRADCFDATDEAENMCSKQTTEANDECASNPCRNGATCNDEEDAYTCTCTSDINECLSGPCQHRGRCIDGIDRYRCICRRGWTGANCEARFNPCVSEPCQNGGTCKGTVNAYTCQCIPGWSGSNCELATCAEDEFACIDGSACVPANYYCDYLPDCNDNSDESGCACNVHYEFQCTNGGCIYDTWVCDGVDDCFDGSDESNNLCRTSGSTNECASNPCQNGGRCENGFERYTCICESGWEGANCEIYIYECRSRPCLNGGRCEDQVNSYTCICQRGWTGINCEHTGMEQDGIAIRGQKDEHINNPTPPSDINECSSEPCQNEGSCEGGLNGYSCKCAPGYTGTNCEQNINECASRPCQHGGTCEDGTNGYICRCVAGYMGINCEQDINECDSMPCRNGGLCVDGVDGYQCQCQPGWTGTLCEIYWSEWTSWSSCSRSCGGGRESRSRHCIGGSSCAGSANEERDCNSQVCPHWSVWSSWSTCSRSCGGGRESRSRYCVDGASCQGLTNDERACNTQTCPYWSQWTSWSSCSKSCGSGSRSRRRSCVGGNSCRGSDYEEDSCNTDRCRCSIGWRSDDAISDGNYCYRYISSSKTWNEAKEYCLNLGSELVDITTAVENNFVKGMAGGTQIWIGLHRDKDADREEGAYLWNRGNSAPYTKWDSKQPSYFYFGEELCVVMRTNGKWNDKICDDRNPFVCEKRRPR